MQSKNSLFSILKYTSLAVALSIVVSCSKEDNQILPVQVNDYLVESKYRDEVSKSVISMTAQLAGYPQFSAYLQYSIKLFVITYRTTYKGEPIIASGIISFPITSDSMPIMLVGNGLIFADEDAPSRFDLPNHFTGFEFIASVGYITLIPDMIGYGMSRDLLFPIQNYEHSANSMIDFLYACEEFIKEKNIPTSQKKFLTGYSQGGYIAMATLKKIEEHPELDINIDATAVGAGGFNLVNLLNYSLDKNYYSAPSHLALLLSSYNIVYDWNRPLSDFFQEPYASEIPYLIDGGYNREEIDQQLAYSFDSLLNPVFLHNLKNNSEERLMDALTENSVDNWVPTSTLRIIHSINDDRIPISDSEDMYNQMVSKGSDSVTFTKIETVGHIESGLAFIEIALQWFNTMR